MKAIQVVGVVIAMTIVGCVKQNPRTIAKIDSDASPKGQFPWEPMDGYVITTWIDPHAGTMATLYGNEVAVAQANANDRIGYPPGSIVSLVTWKQKEDPRWFGAKVPGTVQSVEFVTVAGSEGRTIYHYRRFEGSPSAQTSSSDGPAPNERSVFLLSQSRSPMP
jgi:hypothetical protein